MVDISKDLATKAYSNAILESAKDYADNILPQVSSADNGKVLMVVNDQWEAAEIPTWQGGNY